MSFWSNLWDDFERGVDNVISSFADLLIAMWDTIKEVAIWIVTYVVSFSRHIVRFFRNLKSRNKITSNVRAINVKVGELLEDEKNISSIDIGLTSSNSEDVILSGLFDVERGEFDLDNVQVVEFRDLDEQLKNNFDGKSIMELK